MPIGLPLGDIMDTRSLNYYKNYQDFDYSKYSRNGENFRLSHFAAGGPKQKKSAKTVKVPRVPKTTTSKTHTRANARIPKVTKKVPPAKPKTPKKTSGRKRGGAEASPTYLTVPIKSIYNTSSLAINNNWEYVPIKKLSSVPYSHFQSQ